MQSSTSRRHGARSRLGIAAMLAGVIVGSVGLSAGPVAGEEIETQTVPLQNQDAPVGSDCPDDGGTYWHFVTAPNSDTYSFVSITVQVGAESFTFDDEIVPNNGQTDNVFVPVPAGYELGDLVQSGTSAEITPATGSVKFVLSHLCPGTTTTTSTTTSTTSTTTSTTSTTTSSTTSSTTSTTTSTTSTTQPCEWDPQLPPDHPDCVEPTTTTTSTTTTTTTSTTTTTTTQPCEWNPDLEPGDPDCVPAIGVSSICFDIDNAGEIERYWHRISNDEGDPLEVAWNDGSGVIPANGSLIISSGFAELTISHLGKVAATTSNPASEFCQNTVEITKLVDGPETGPATYTIQISRLVGADYLPEGDAYQLTGGQTIAVPLPSTFNPEGVNYFIEEIDAGGAHASSVTPDTFVLNGHKNETISVTIENTFAAVSLDKTVSATVVEPGDELNYTLIAENTGALTLGPLSIYDRLPPEVVYVDASIDGPGSCTLVEATAPQLVRCDLPVDIDTGEFTPAITLLVEVLDGLTTSDPILNQAMVIGNYADALVDGGTEAIGGEHRLVAVLATDLSCNPAPGEVCDLSARIGTTVEIPAATTTIAAQSPPTTVGTSGAGATVPAELPATGSDATSLLTLIGAALTLFGLVLVVGARRPAPATDRI